MHFVFCGAHFLVLLTKRRIPKKEVFVVPCLTSCFKICCCVYAYFEPF